uniref:Uncharacterized protein n=1 Tax=Candidatus Kentrum sp. DK TaxID=2126562 RepID=A0A450T885_9GAMM|nr:MAG: hypothetical protein BECKDK2373C_GA0170839_11027 [Candidatus Kentron sp. DK]
MLPYTGGPGYKKLLRFFSRPRSKKEARTFGAQQNGYVENFITLGNGRFLAVFLIFLREEEREEEENILFSTPRHLHQIAGSCGKPPCRISK